MENVVEGAQYFVNKKKKEDVQIKIKSYKKVKAFLYTRQMDGWMDLCPHCFEWHVYGHV